MTTAAQLNTATIAPVLCRCRVPVWTIRQPVNLYVAIPLRKLLTNLGSEIQLFFLNYGFPQSNFGIYKIASQAIVVFSIRRTICLLQRIQQAMNGRNLQTQKKSVPHNNHRSSTPLSTITLCSSVLIPLLSKKFNLPLGISSNARKD